MKVRSLTGLLPLAGLLSIGSASIAGEEFRPVAHFAGIINDYSPSTVKGGPWEMHGQWSMQVRRDGRYGDFADFYADMTMSGYVTAQVVTPGSPEAMVPVQTQGGVNPHTHHIRLNNAKIQWDMTGCPTFLPPATL